MPDKPRAELAAFRHECNIPRAIVRRPWKCPVCKARWVPEGKGAWHTESGGRGVITSVTMRYPDGSEETFDDQ